MLDKQYAVVNAVDEGVDVPDYLRSCMFYTYSLIEANRRSEDINKRRQETQDFGELPKGTLTKVVERTVTYGDWQEVSAKIMKGKLRTIKI